MALTNNRAQQARRSNSPSAACIRLWQPGRTLRFCSLGARGPVHGDLREAIDNLARALDDATATPSSAQWQMDLHRMFDRAIRLLEEQWRVLERGGSPPHREGTRSPDKQIKRNAQRSRKLRFAFAFVRTTMACGHARAPSSRRSACDQTKNKRRVGPDHHHLIAAIALAGRPPQ